MKAARILILAVALAAGGAAAFARLGLGFLENGARRGAALGGGATCSCGPATVARMGWLSGDGFAGALRGVSHGGVDLAKIWSRRGTHHVGTAPFYIAQ